MLRDEYVTSLVLDHGLTMDQVRQKVIEAGFDPLPPEESGQSKRARLKEELQHGVESTKKEIDLPILEGKTFRHAITNPRDKRYIAGVEGYGPESDTQRMGDRDDAEAAACEAEEQDLEDFWGNDPQSYRNKYAPRFPWIQNDVPEDDLEDDEITALDYPSEEMLASWAEDDPSDMEHFEPEEDSAIAVLPADMEDEEVDDGVYY